MDGGRIVDRSYIDDQLIKDDREVCDEDVVTVVDHTSNY